MPDQAWTIRSLLERKWSDLRGHAVSEGALATVDTHVPSAAGNVLVGIDDVGHRHLLVPFPAGTEIPSDLRSGGVHLAGRSLVVQGETVRFADLHCLREDLSGIFVSFCSDLLALVLADRTLRPQRLQDILDAWRDLLAGRQGSWSRAQVAGFFGELLVLERLLGLDPSAARMWRGPYRAPQDFRAGAAALEVKASTAQKGRVVSIHGVEQMRTPPGGRLWLAWMRLDVVSAQAGRSVDQLVDACGALARDPAVVSAAVEASHWQSAPAELRGLHMRLSEERWYPVTTGFPRITTAELIGGLVPDGVSRVSYELDLDVLPDPGGDWEGALRALTEVAP